MADSVDGDGAPGLAFLRSWALERRSRHAAAHEQAPGFADFVVSLKYPLPTGGSGSERQAAAAAAQARLDDVVGRLARAGLGVEVREALRPRRQRLDGAAPGAAEFEPEPGHVLVFVTCPAARLEHAWGRSRLQDWLGGMVVLRRAARDAGAADPLEVDPDTLDDPTRLLDAAGGGAAAGMAVSERQRLVQRLIVGPASDGCAGVAESDEVAVLALHDRAFNRQWLRHWSSKWLIDRHDLKRIREHFGEEIAMYFAFLQSYLLWLAFPAAFGAAWWAVGRSFSWQLGVLLVLWSVLFTETWARRESDIATYWGVHGVQRARLSRRAGFRPDRHVTDPATGDHVPHFSSATRWLRRLAGVPVVAAMALLMAAFIAVIFALQTFLAEYYDGPLPALLGLAPVVLFSACLPAYTAVCTRVAAALTEYENYEYDADHAAQFTAKIFVFRFLQDQLYLFLTAWVFVPHRDAFDAWLQAAYRALRELPPWLMPLAAPGPDGVYAGLKASSTPATVMVRDLLASFVVTSQIVGMVTETGLPLLMRWWKSRSLAKASRTATAADGSGAPLRPHGGQRALASVLALEPDSVDKWVESAVADSAAPAAPSPSLEQQFIAR
ncbi:hypothetical protein IWQ56_002411, partial [Coemansia nantahalensis]